jgi:hypothetical protein
MYTCMNGIQVCIHACMHCMWACMLHVHTYIHTYIHAYIHTCIHTYMHTYTHTHMCSLRFFASYAQASMRRLCVYASMRVCAYVCMRVCAYAPMRLCGCIHAQHTDLSSLKEKQINAIVRLQGLWPSIPEAHPPSFTIAPSRKPVDCR